MPPRGYRRERPAPVLAARADVVRHRAGRTLGIVGQQCFDDGQVFVAFLDEPVGHHAAGVLFPGEVAEGAEEGFQPVELLGQEGVGT